MSLAKMGRDFLAYWKPKTVTDVLRSGGTVSYAASDQFDRVTIGDTIWIVTVRTGRLFLVSRVRVGQVTDGAGASRLLSADPRGLWKADRYVVAAAGTELGVLDADIHHLAATLRFESEADRLAVSEDGKVNAQQLQSIRVLSPGSAELLQAVVDKGGGESGAAARAWLICAFGDDRQYEGNTGYDDDLSRTYRYDSNVSNHKGVRDGDIAILRNRDGLVGIAQVERVESFPSEKMMQRCPVCRVTDLKARKKMVPKFRCDRGHEFAEPRSAKEPCTEYEASFGASFLPAADPIPMVRLRNACPRFADQLSIQRVELARIRDELRRAVPRADEVLDRRTSATAKSSKGHTPPLASVHDVLPGRMGTDYCRPDEECTVVGADPFEVDPAAVERGTRAHARTQNLLADHIGGLGIRPCSPGRGEPDYDLGWEVGNRLFVAEIKSLLPGNESRQLRLGLGQILEYRHLLGRGGRPVTAVLMLERPPARSAWTSLATELGVLLVWPECLAQTSAALCSAD